MLTVKFFLSFQMKKYYAGNYVKIKKNCVSNRYSLHNIYPLVYFTSIEKQCFNLCYARHESLFSF